MSKVYTTAVVIIPPREIWGSIQDIRRKYDKQIHRWMPHITLLYPFRPFNDFDMLESLFKIVCKKIESFEISFHNFNYFHHGKQKFTIWLNPESGKMIEFLQSKLLKVVPECNDVNLHKIGFTPHLSVGQIMGRTNLNEVLSTLQSSWNPLKFNLTSVYFIARENQKDSVFKIKKEFKLK
ncbi:MAG: 2'-5' RNA ligase family protein [Candidatus Hermodarchaeota archaeon]